MIDLSDLPPPIPLEGTADSRVWASVRRQSHGIELTFDAAGKQQPTRYNLCDGAAHDLANQLRALTERPSAR